MLMAIQNPRTSLRPSGPPDIRNPRGHRRHSGQLARWSTGSPCHGITPGHCLYRPRTHPRCVGDAMGGPAGEEWDAVVDGAVECGDFGVCFFYLFIYPMRLEGMSVLIVIIDSSMMIWLNLLFY